ncbi:septal ring lytic transglycosylase RlpA family protein [Hymenobacter cheonanensis]|uniref:septal ring lytic transglycosylase RlpA family protein n=1 Tax=Hymenobacter sp. CA2-7 TaxID=3063993 RepID=UPI0027122123|nr:septal ring lytic transglycosylase RlpA family protein [Hymenobacter sp. CA2-7]MDO7884752.1 septal ring lytic transglycosylase RlpA family protein [Hymenobacter sp. CA2-7]
MLGTGLVLPAEARTNRAHKLHRRHARRRIHIPRMLPTFIPAAREGYATILRGRASWYGKRFQGKKTTSGERFNRHEYTCAHKTLPFGTRLRVTNLDNGVTVVVRVTDRGPFRHERIIDLAEVAARPLGLVEAGAATVVAEIVEPTTPLGLTDTPSNLEQLQAADPNPHAPFTAYLLPEFNAPALAAAPAASPAPAGPLATDAAASPSVAPRFLVQAGTYAEPQSARAALARILTIDQSLPAEIVTTTVDGRPHSRVVIGQLDSWLAAETVRRNLQLWGMAALVCQLPAGATVASTEKATATLAVAGPLK